MDIDLFAVPLYHSPKYLRAQGDSILDSSPPRAISESSFLLYW